LNWPWRRKRSPSGSSFFVQTKEEQQTGLNHEARQTARARHLALRIAGKITRARSAQEQPTSTITPRDHPLRGLVLFVVIQTFDHARGTVMFRDEIPFCSP
jgi:hypothetical protein